MKKMRQAIAQALILGLLPAVSWSGPVDINTADAATLARELDGIGQSRAEAIVEYRQAHGPFRSAADLIQVKGVGPRILEENRGNIRVGPTKETKAESKTQAAKK